MKLSPAAKVGLVSLAAVVVMGTGFSWLTQWSLKPRGYRLKAVFSDVHGLSPGANVMLMGVKVGRVLDLDPQERTVVVDLEISNPRTRIIEGSRFKILTKGIIGDKNLEIFPPPRTEIDSFLEPGTLVYGDDPARMETAIEQANAALKSIKDIADSPDTRRALKDGIQNFESAFKDLRELIKHTDEVAVSANALIGDARSLRDAVNPSDVRAIVRDLRALSAGLRQGYNQVMGNGTQIEDAKQTLANLRSLTERLDKISAEAEALATDPKLQKDVRDIVSSSRTVVQTFGSVGGSKLLPQSSPRFEVFGVQDPAASYLAGNFGMGLRFPRDKFLAGIEEIGERNLWNLSWGKPGFFSSDLGFHLGMVRSKIGLGLDYEPAEWIAFSGELFDPRTPQLRVAATYYPDFLGMKYGLSAQWIRDLSIGDASLRVGLQWRPLD